MAKIDQRRRAVELRRQGKSYTQIKRVVKVSKSTLSLWLRDFPLSAQRMKEVRDHNEQRIENFRKTMRAKRNARLAFVYKTQKKKLFPLTKRDLLIAGLFLYWGEGEKASPAQAGISNTDPAVLKFFIQWLKQIFGVPKNKMRVYLHLYSDMDADKEMSFWSQTLNIPISQFRKPYIKNNKRSFISYKSGFGHGTCNILVGNVHLSEKILMSIQCVRDYVLSDKTGA